MRSVNTAAERNALVPQSVPELILQGRTLYVSTGIIAGAWAAVSVENQNADLQAALGSRVKAQTCDVALVTSTAALADGSLVMKSIFVDSPVLVSGVSWIQAVQGDYTADNNNKLGLCSFDHAGGLTLVASTADNGNLWKGTANTLASADFLVPYFAASGVYYIFALYNSSAQVTAPTIASLLAGNAAVSALDYGNSVKTAAILAAQTDLPATLAMSTATGSSTHRWFGLY